MAKTLQFTAETSQLIRSVSAVARELKTVKNTTGDVVKTFGRMESAKVSNPGLKRQADDLRKLEQQAKSYGRTLNDLARQNQRNGIVSRSIAKTQAITRVGDARLNLTATGRAAAASGSNSDFAVAARAVRDQRQAIANLIREKRGMVRETARLAQVERVLQDRARQEFARLAPQRRYVAQREAAARSTVAGIRSITRGARDLDITPTGRALATTDSTTWAAEQARRRQAERNARAAELRQQRQDQADRIRRRESMGQLAAIQAARQEAEEARLAPRRQYAERRVESARERIERVRDVTRGARDLDLSQTGRALAASDSTSFAAAEARQRQAERNARAAELRQQRRQDQAQSRSTARREQLRRTGGMVMRGGLDVAGAVGLAGTALGHTFDAEVDRYAGNMTRDSALINPLSGVDQNAIRRERLRRDVQAAAVGAGVSAQDYAAARFTLESAAADLPADVRNNILAGAMGFHKLQGTDMSTAAGAINSAYQLVGNDFGGGPNAVRAITNKMAFAADVGAFEVDEVAPYQSMILSSFKSFGFSADEGMAALAYASRSGMRPETLATGIRNLPMVANLAKTKGFDPADNLVDLLEQFSKMQPEEILNVTGRDPFAALDFLIKNRSQVAAVLRDLEAIGAGSDVLGSKISKFGKDPAYFPAEVIRSAEELADQAPTRKLDESPAIRDSVTSSRIIEAGRQLESTPLTSYFTWIGSRLEMLNNAIYGLAGAEESQYGGAYMQRGLETLIADARQAGDVGRAGYLRLKFGDNDEAGANEFLRLRAGGYTDLSDGEFREVQRLRDGGDSAKANEYLDRVGKPKVPDHPVGTRDRGMFSFSKPFEWNPPEPLRVKDPRTGLPYGEVPPPEMTPHRTIAFNIGRTLRAELAGATEAGDINAMGDATKRFETTTAVYNRAERDGMIDTNEAARIAFAADTGEDYDQLEYQANQARANHRKTWQAAQADGVFTDQERINVERTGRAMEDADAKLESASKYLAEVAKSLEGIMKLFERNERDRRMNQRLIFDQPQTPMMPRQ